MLHKKAVDPNSDLARQQLDGLETKVFCFLSQQLNTTYVK